MEHGLRIGQTRYVQVMVKNKSNPRKRAETVEIQANLAGQKKIQPRSVGELWKMVQNHWENHLFAEWLKADESGCAMEAKQIHARNLENPW